MTSEREIRTFARVFKISTVFAGEHELVDRRRVETLPTVVREVAASAAAPVEAGAPKVEIAEGAQTKHVAPGPATLPTHAAAVVVGGEEEVGGVGGAGKGRTLGEAIKESLGLGRPSGGAEPVGAAGGATKGGTALTAAEERAAVSRAEA